MSCALDGDGVAWCWGPAVTVRNAVGTISRGSDVPVPIASPQPFEALTVGGEHACALDRQGRAWCWGQNRTQAMGVVEPMSAEALPVLGIHAFASISAGSAHTCARTAAGRVWCWGASTQVGILNFRSNRDVPVEVETLPDSRAISAGAFHTCAIDNSGLAWCWGGGMADVLGRLPGSDASAVSNHDTDLPTRVSGGLVFEQIAAGGRVTCGVDVRETTWCWGRNDLGQAGRW